MARSLGERPRAHEQQTARLAEQEPKLKTAECKARTPRLIEAGSLIEKTGLLDLDANALYGALLSLRDESSNATEVEQWVALGRKSRRGVVEPAAKPWAAHAALLPRSRLRPDRGPAIFGPSPAG